MRVNIQNREQFEYALQAIKNADFMSVDTETNGLFSWGDNELIGISVYIPDTGDGFYFPFRHGKGRVEIDYSKTNHAGLDYHEMNWSGKAKGQIFLGYWFNKFKMDVGLNYFENIPIEWMDELKEVWGHQHMLFHNASFDLDFLCADGFPKPRKAWDTMVSLHITHEDLHGVNVKAPFKYSTNDKRKGLCRTEDLGMWAVEPDGSLKLRKQQANRKLKWFSAFIGLPRATEGEMELRSARLEFEEALTDYIMANLDDPMSESLVYKQTPKPTRLSTKYPEPMVQKRISEGYRKGLARASYVHASPTMLKNVFYVDTDYKFWREGYYAIYDGYQIDYIENPDAHAIFYNEEYNAMFYDMVAYGEQWDKVRSKVSVSEKANMWMLPSGRVWDYAVLDVELTNGLLEWCMPIIKEWDNEALHEKHQDVMYKVAWEMGQVGFQIDVESAHDEIIRLDERITEIENILQDIARDHDLQEIFEMGSDDGFNPHGWQQLAVFLQSGVLKEPYTDIFPDWFPTTAQVDLKTYDTIPSGTSRAILEEFEDHPIIKLVFELKRLQKSSNVYLKNWINGRDPRGRVHFNMDSTGTVSGRFSSWGKPAGNAQNIPDRNGYTVKRSVIVPDEDWVFLAIDYGQLEARLASWIAEGLLGFGNHEMTDLFLAGVDMHSHVADDLDVKTLLYGDMSYEAIAEYNGESVSKLGDDLEHTIYQSYIRQVAKTCNFGLLYNGTEYMMSRELKIPLATAKVLVDHWREMFPAFSKAQEYYTEQALTIRKRPNSDEMAMYVTQPISGRHRKLHKYDTWAWYEENGVRKGFNPQEASAKKTWNNIVQGLGGYICTVSALEINSKYGQSVKWFANIHDALDGYIRRDSLGIVPDICNIMTNWEIIPNLTVDVETSETNWQDMSKVRDMELWIATEGKQWR